MKITSRTKASAKEIYLNEASIQYRGYRQSLSKRLLWFWFRP